MICSKFVSVVGVLARCKGHSVPLLSDAGRRIKSQLGNKEVCSASCGNTGTICFFFLATAMAASSSG